MNGFSLLPERASTLAAKVDVLFYTLVGLTGSVALAIIVLMLVFAIRYRKGSAVDRTLAPQRTGASRGYKVELTWIFTPLALFMIIFVWGAVLYVDYFLPPANAMPVFVVAKQWMWKLEHPSGQREINELHVPRGTPVKLVMTSQDVIHSFFIPAFRIKRDVLPGSYTTLWFNATQAGEFHLFCAEYCGTDHSRMTGRVVVMEPADFQRWLAAHNPESSMAQSGEVLFRQFGCSGCHGANATVHAPKLEGLFGKPVPLQGGGTGIADERYIRDSVLLPLKDIAAGYQPIMPSFAGQVDEEQLLDLIAYIKSLAQEERRMR